MYIKNIVIKEYRVISKFTKDKNTKINSIVIIFEILSLSC